MIVLVAGGSLRYVETPAVLELATASPTRIRRVDAEPLVRRMLTELGIEPVDRTRAPWIVVRDVARQMIAGDLPPEDGARTLWGLWWACGSPQEIGLMLEPLEAWDETLPADRDDEAIRAQLRALAPGVLELAEARLADGTH